MVDAVLYTKIRAAKERDITVNYKDGQGQSAQESWLALLLYPLYGIMLCQKCRKEVSFVQSA